MQCHKMALEAAARYSYLQEKKTSYEWASWAWKSQVSQKNLKQSVQDFQKCFALLCPMMPDFGMKIAHIFWKLGSFSGQEVFHS